MIIADRQDELQAFSSRWKLFSRGHYRCIVYVHPDETGGFYAYLPELPGVVGEGDTEDEVLADITEAFRGAISAYRDAGEAIPWHRERVAKPDEAREYRIVVDV